MHRFALITATLLVLVALPAPASSHTLPVLTASQVRFWDRVAVCETGGRWDWGAEHRRSEGKTYQGGVGFYWATWQWWAGELGLLHRYPAAYLAPRLVQMEVAEYGYTQHSGYWGSIARGCA